MLHEKTDIELWCIRHAQCEANKNPQLLVGRSVDSPLTLQGKMQSIRLGDRFLKEKIKFQAVYSSPQPRSIETANISLTKINHPLDKIKLIPELMEFTHGDWEGENREETYTDEILLAMNQKGKYFTPPNGESQRMVERRMSNWVEDEILYNPNYLEGEQRIAIFSHGLAIKCLLHYVMGFNDRLIYSMDLPNTGIARLRFNKKGWQVGSTNDCAHLYRK